MKFCRILVFASCVSLLSTASLPAQSTVTELNEAGWNQLQQGYPDRAAKTFAEALGYRPNDPVLLLGAASAAHAQGRPSDAIKTLRRVLVLQPTFTEASRLLGEIAFTEGDTELAISTYEKALKHAPDDQRIANRLREWRADADVHSRFEERRYDRFRVLFEGRAEEALAARATEILNREFRRIGETLGAFPSDTVVTLLYTERQFRDITRAPDWSAGIYDGRIRVPAAGAAQNGELFERVLTHELTHAMLAQMAPRGVPTWLHEGLAQYLSGDDPAAARQRLRAFGRTIPLKSLEGSFARLTALQAQIAYDESLLAVAVIFERPGFAWVRLFSALAENDRTESTLGSFGFSYADLEAAFKP